MDAYGRVRVSEENSRPHAHAHLVYSSPHPRRKEKKTSHLWGSDP